MNTHLTTILSVAVFVALFTPATAPEAQVTQPPASVSASPTTVTMPNSTPFAPMNFDRVSPVAIEAFAVSPDQSLTHLCVENPLADDRKRKDGLFSVDLNVQLMPNSIRKVTLLIPGPRLLISKYQIIQGTYCIPPALDKTGNIATAIVNLKTPEGTVSPTVLLLDKAIIGEIGKSAATAEIDPAAYRRLDGVMNYSAAYQELLKHGPPNAVTPIPTDMTHGSLAFVSNESGGNPTSGWLLWTNFLLGSVAEARLDLTINSTPTGATITVQGAGGSALHTTSHMNLVSSALDKVVVSLGGDRRTVKQCKENTEEFDNSVREYDCDFTPSKAKAQ